MLRVIALDPGAAEVIDDNHSEADVLRGGPPDDELVAAYREGHAALVRALREASLFLWNRCTASAADIAATGDTSVLRAWSGDVRVRWT